MPQTTRQSVSRHTSSSGGPRARFLIKALVFCITSLLSFPVLAEKPPMKWGKIDMEHLKMTSFPQDSNAAVVILCSFGQAYLDNRGWVNYSVHKRIKILKESGYDWGTISVSYRSAKNVQRIRGIAGQTFVLGDDGKIVKHKLEGKSIFKEGIDENYERMRFTLPSLEPGAVIEYKYTIEANSPLYLDGWTFQSSEPTLWSEYRAWVPHIFRFVAVGQGAHPFHINESIPEIRFDLDGDWQRYVQKDIPALRSEPYVTTLEDYRSRIRFQLAQISVPGQFQRNYLTSWGELAQELINNDSFGGQRKKKGLIPPELKTKLAAMTSPEEKMKAVYDYLRETVEWDGRRGIFTNEGLSSALKKRSASGPEMAFMLISMFNEIGLDAAPVILSTRSHGKIQQLYPIATQFNHVLAHVHAGEKTFLLDATDPNRPHNMLPYQALNSIGWLVEKNAARWVEIKPESRLQRRVAVNARIDEDGKIQGKVQAIESGYSAIYKRDFIKENDEEAFVKKYYTNEIFNFEPDSVSIKNLDNAAKPLTTTLHFSSDELVQAAGDMIYLNPIFLTRFEENPLTLPERTFPVDYGYGRDITYTLSLTLPEGFIVAEQPKNISMSLPKAAGNFKRICQIEGNHLSVLSMFKIKKAVFSPEEYQALKAFYDQVVSAQNEQIVLKRATN